ncbi:hypothetical protein D9M71_681240 [compost metagenome]
MDQVDQYRAAAGLATPGRGIEIVVRLVEQRAPLHRHQITEYTFSNQLPGLGENRAVRTMVAYQ